MKLLRAEREGRSGTSKGWSAGLMACSLALWAGAARADVLNDVQCTTHEGKRSEIAFTITGWIQSSDIDALARCLPRKERPLPKKADPARSFAKVRWVPKHLATLDACNFKRCVYNIPNWGVKRVMAGSNIEEKKRAYYDVVHQLSWSVKKKQKRERIEAHHVKSEICSQHDLFHWLINGDLRPWDRVIWRKIFSHKRMRPTLTTSQMSSWRKGPHRCIGTTLLFADHYYWDALDLLQLTPQGGDRIAFRLHVRGHSDIFNGWWARRFRGTIRKVVRERKIKILRDRVSRCLAGT